MSISCLRGSWIKNVKASSHTGLLVPYTVWIINYERIYKTEWLQKTWIYHKLYTWCITRTMTSYPALFGGFLHRNLHHGAGILIAFLELNRNTSNWKHQHLKHSFNKTRNGGRRAIQLQNTNLQVDLVPGPDKQSKWQQMEDLLSYHTLWWFFYSSPAPTINKRV